MTVHIKSTLQCPHINIIRHSTAYGSTVHTITFVSFITFQTIFLRIFRSFFFLHKTFNRFVINSLSFATIQYNTMCVVQVDYCYLTMRGMIRIIIRVHSLRMIFSSLLEKCWCISAFWSKFILYAIRKHAYGIRYISSDSTQRSVNNSFNLKSFFFFN